MLVLVRARCYAFLLQYTASPYIIRSTVKLRTVSRLLIGYL